MPGLLLHSPANIVKNLLVSLGMGVDPITPPAIPLAWSVFVNSRPQTPDNLIVVYDAEGREHGRAHVSGERQLHHGVQIELRSDTYRVGYERVRAMAVSLDQDVYQETVTIAGVDYRVHAITRTSDVSSIGKESPTSKRNIFHIDCLVSVRMV